MLPSAFGIKQKYIIMIKKFLSITAIALMAAASVASAANRISPANKEIVYSGRVNFSNPESPLMVYPGTSIKANFTGSQISMMAKPGSGYFMVSVDNLPAQKIFFSKNDSIITLADGLKGNRHSVDVMLVYEGYNDRPEFRGFLLDDGARILQAPRLPQRKLEFIGNSITCGYGTEAPNGDVHYSDANSNHFYTYAVITSRALNAQHHVVARSGIGMYRNYNGKREGDKDIMPLWYDYTSLYDDSQLWNHASYEADVICICLGTNDFSTPNYDAKIYQSNYEKFVKYLRKLHPKSKIVMITGPMLKGEASKVHVSAVDAAFGNLKNDGIKDIYRFDFSTQTGDLGYGADYHPSKAQHVKMSNELIPFLRSITGWK